MGSKPDFTQKLLNDLRLRKERMAGAQRPHTADSCRGSSRDFFMQHKGAKPIQTIGPKNGSTHRNVTSNNTMTQQSVNQIVPYGGGHHQSVQKGDISMAISYAFDNVGNLKAFELKSNAAMVNLLQQIGKRSMQWQPTNEFPTLTHLHIDEVARGAQKLNQILKACTGGLNVGKGSVEVGKELWKGATDLEQSLRMLVSLQEASNCIIKPQRKSRLKLLEEGEDFDDENSITTVKQKQVERPVFSFDKPSKKTKETVKPERQGSMVSKGSHRRSASCGPEFQQPSQLVNSSKPKESTQRLPNVIAKLMGLEEVPPNADSRPVTEVQTRPKHRSGELVLRTLLGNSRSGELKAENDKNFKIQGGQNRMVSTKTIMAANAQELQEGKTYQTASMTDSYYYRTTLDPQNNTWKEERVGVRNSVSDSQEAIYKVNELIKQMVQTSETGMEARVSTVTQKQQAVKNGIQALQRIVESAKKSSEVQQKTSTVLKKTNIKLQTEVLPTPEPRVKKLRTEKNTSQPTANNKSQHRKKASRPPKPAVFHTVPSNSSNMQKQQNAIQNNTDKGGAASNTLPVIENALANSELKEKCSESLKSGQNSHLTEGETDSEVCKMLNVEAKSGSVSRRKAELTTQRRKPNVTSVKANEKMTRPGKTSTKTVRKQKPLKQILHGQNTKILEKLIDSGGKTSKSTQAVAEPCTSPKHEETQETTPKQTSTTNVTKTDESFRLQVLDELPSTNRSDFKSTTIPDIQEAQYTVDDDHKAKPQKIVTHGLEDGACTSRNHFQEQQKHSAKVKQERLTEDEINLKQKLLQSHVFLNTAEALFKLHIPIGILNYASDQINPDKSNNLILDCGYELLKKKGRRKEMSLYPNISKVMKCTEVRSLDDLVRQMHKDFETLQSYGRRERDEYDEVEYLLNMLEQDMFYRAPDLNCMWDLGWNDTVFAYTDADEAIRDVEQSLLDELLGEIVADCF